MLVAFSAVGVSLSLPRLPAKTEVDTVRSKRPRALAVFLTAIVLAFGAAYVYPQTAHYSGVVTTVATGFNGPTALAFDSSGNLIVSDTGNHAVKLILAVNGVIPDNPTVITLSNHFGSPRGVASAGAGQIYVADYGANATDLLAYTLSNGVPASTITELGGVTSPLAVCATFLVVPLVTDSQGNIYLVIQDPQSPGGVYVDKMWNVKGAARDVTLNSSNDVFVADYSDNDIKEIPQKPASYGPGKVETIASGFKGPSGVAVDGAGNLLVSDSGNNAVKEVVAVNGSIPAAPTVITLGNGFSSPYGIRLDGAGNVFVVDSGNNAVKKIAPQVVDFGSADVGSAGATILVPFLFDSPGTPSGWSVLPNQKGANPGLDFSEVTASTTCSTSQAYHIGDTCSVAVQFSPQRPGLRTGVVQLKDADGNVMATAHLKGIGQGAQIQFPGNTTQNVWAPGIVASGVAVDAAGDLFFSVPDRNEVEELVAERGVIPPSPVTRRLGSGFSSPEALAVDAAGDVFVFDAGNSAVKEILAVNGSIPDNPTIVTLAAGLSKNAFGLSFDGLSLDAAGSLYISDNTVLELQSVNGAIPPDAPMTTVADGLPMVNGNAGVDSAGNVFFATSRQGWYGLDEIVPAESGYPAAPNVTMYRVGDSNLCGAALDAAGDVILGAFYLEPEVVLNTNGVLSVESSQQIALPFGDTCSPVVDAAGNVFFAAGNTVYPDSLKYTLTEQLLASPPSVTFPSETRPGDTDTADGPQTVTIVNNGNEPLIFPIPATGTNPSVSTGFAWDDSSTCAQTTPGSATAFAVEPGGSCTIAIDFAPTMPGSVTGSVVLTDNSGNTGPPSYATHIISLSGTGLPFTTLTSPLPGSTLPGPSVTFQWGAPAGITLFQLLLGTTGPGSSDVYSGAQTTNKSATVSNIPVSGATLYARLLFWQNSAWQWADTSYAEANLPYMTFPVPGSTLSGGSVTFTWQRGAGVHYFRLYVGTEGAGSQDVYQASTTDTSVKVTVPVNGATLYVRLSYIPPVPPNPLSPWQPVDYTYTEATPRAPSMTSPAPGSTLTGSSATFQWDPGAGVSLFELLVGTGPGRGDFYRGGPTTATSIPVSNIPTQGKKIFAQLFYQFRGRWYSILYWFTEAPRYQTVP